ncbi:class I adenylate-forming enzyme family protein [Loktanella agnita]|uniref:class I adenylate-forming enzyme family protein n=1 Tax=Loktanella agnita TaxID=287097 RepID=UPI00398948D4
MPLSAALSRHGRERPDACAAVIGGRAVSYGALTSRASRLSRYISALPRVPRSQKALRDVPVFAVIMGNHPMITEFLAAALAGECCIILLDPLLPSDQLGAMLDQLSPDILFVAGQGTAPFEGRAFSVMRTEGDVDLDRLIADIPTTPLIEACDDAPFLVAFTSGTTSRPKAFLRQRHSWRTSFAAGRAHFETGPNLHTLSPGPLAHGLSLYAFAETLEAGATFYAPEKFNAAECAAVIAENQLARLVCVPSVLDALCRHSEALRSLRQITTAGAKLEDNLLRRIGGIAQQARVTEYYGASELGFVTTVSHDPGAAEDTPGSAGVGYPFPGVDITLRSCTDGAGTVWVRSALMIDSYLWQDDTLGLQRDGDWGSVGDIGRIDEDGCLHLVSRAGGMVISGGNNIYPDEVMTCLQRHSAVKQACVVGIPDAALGQTLVAVLEWEEEGPQPTLADLRDHCRAQLQKYKVPRRFLITSEWPMTSSGKIATGQLTHWIMQEDEQLAPL